MQIVRFARCNVRLGGGGAMRSSFLSKRQRCAILAGATGRADLGDPALTEGLALQFYWGLSVLLMGAALSWRALRRQSA
ncbi:protein of unknown function [Burkholderia multivorans]